VDILKIFFFRMYIHTYLSGTLPPKTNWGEVRKRARTNIHTYPHKHTNTPTQTLSLSLSLSLYIYIYIYISRSTWGESPPPAPDMCNFADEEEEACGESVSTRGVATGVERGSERGRDRDRDTETERDTHREGTDTDVNLYTPSPAGAPFSSVVRPISGAASTNKRLRAPLSPRPGGDRKIQVPPRMEERRTMGIYN
jgi:hypothetical protein